MSSLSLMINFRQRFVLVAAVLAVFSLVSPFLAPGQATDFSLTALGTLHAVNPGENSSVNLQLLGIGGSFNNSVSFTTIPCTVTPVLTTATPVCLVSPDSAIPGSKGANISVTLMTMETTLPGNYQVTVTGTSGGLTHSVTLSLGVEPLAADYTLSVSPTTANPNPINAGSNATTTVTVSPIGSYSGHTVTLACLSVSPTVELAPVCSFNPAQVLVNGGTPPTSVLTISTTGPAPIVKAWKPQVFYALWIFLPGLALVGFRTGTRRKNSLRALGLMLVVGSVFLIPACSATKSTSSGSVTPKNTYLFTLSGADENGALPSNTTTNEATVSVTVN